MHDTDWKLAHLDRFVKHFEPEWRPATHSNYERLNHALPALIGIKMQVEQVIGKAKLHQQLASTEISLLAEKLHHIEKSNSIPQLMQDIAAPWAREREARVALARDKKTLPIIPAKNDSKNHK
ncbi:hypothetical protein [Arcanobacterium hippocoleae]|uniref:hypothetical protein n=1 Tax=Arcanobacterium hippocoleae TaxID=149017 RepID=UPI003340153D